jgi:hypothetical protein
VGDFHNDFVQEAQRLLDIGINHNDIRYRLSFFSFICDAPARAFLKCIKGHTGYYSCERCTAKGSWNGRVVYNYDVAFAPRTQHQFENLDYKDHQVARSPLIDLRLDIVHIFSLDYMHLVCLGVGKRILSFLTSGPTECRLSHQQRTQISEKLVGFNGRMPSEFARQPRSLSELDRWKATELRQFLLYTGPVVLRGVVSDAVCEHFLSLSVAISIMLDSNSEKRAAYLDYAQELLTYFVENAKDIYGDILTVYNVHNLLHLHEDVRYFNTSLNEVSAFPFENHLQRIKKLVKKAQNSIAQVTKRLAEVEKAHARRTKPKRSCISIRRKDRCFLLKNENVAFVREKRPNGDLLCDVIAKGRMLDFFESPCRSKLLNILFIRETAMRIVSREKVLRASDLNRKAVCLAYKDGFVIFPLLHGDEHRYQ